MTKKYGVEIAILSVQIQTSALIWFAGRQLLKKNLHSQIRNKTNLVFYSVSLFGWLTVFFISFWWRQCNSQVLSSLKSTSVIQ